MSEATAFAHRLANLPWQALQDTKMVLNQHLRQASVTSLGYGFAAKANHTTPPNTEPLPNIPARNPHRAAAR